MIDDLTPGQREGRAEQPPVITADLAAFMACPLARTVTEATRIVHVGKLSSYSGVADFLSCAIAWAESNPRTPINLCWAGHGDMEGVLRAQLIPLNLTQTFIDPTRTDELADLFKQCGLLVVPSLSHVDRHLIPQAMAAGLLVLGSNRCPQVRTLIAPNVTGWLFDPLVARQMSAALDTALTTPTIMLAEMRKAARYRAGTLATTPAISNENEWGCGRALLATSRPA